MNLHKPHTWNYKHHLQANSKPSGQQNYFYLRTWYQPSHFSAQTYGYLYKQYHLHRPLLQPHSSYFQTTLPKIFDNWYLILTALHIHDLSIPIHTTSYPITFINSIIDIDHPSFTLKTVIIKPPFVKVIVNIPHFTNPFSLAVLVLSEIQITILILIRSQ